MYLLLPQNPDFNTSFHN